MSSEPIKYPNTAATLPVTFPDLPEIESPDSPRGFKIALNRAKHVNGHSGPDGKSPMDRIVDSLCNIRESQVTARRETQVAIQESLRESGHEAHARTLHAQFGPVICHKTGRLIANRPLSDIQELVAIHGPEGARQILSDAPNALVCHPAWMDTSPERLAKLANLDPASYFIYTAYRLLPAAALPTVQTTGGRMATEPHQAAIRLKHLLNTRLRRELNSHNPHDSDILRELLIKANELNRRFLAFSDGRHFKTPDECPLATWQSAYEALPSLNIQGLETLLSDWIRLVIQNINRLMQSYLRAYSQTATRAQQRARESRRGRAGFLSVADIANLRLTYGGSASFRYQGSLNPMTADEYIARQIEELDLFNGSTGKEELFDLHEQARAKRQAEQARQAKQSAPKWQSASKLGPITLQFGGPSAPGEDEE